MIPLFWWLQVANFHNTIGDRMIASQRPMMLEAALDLARLVQEQNGVTWSDTAAVDKYIVRLQTAVERLSRENNKLASYHAQIRDKVIHLVTLIINLVMIKELRWLEWTRLEQKFVGSIYYQKVKHSNGLLLICFTNVSQLYCLFVTNIMI